MVLVLVIAAAALVVVAVSIAVLVRVRRGRAVGDRRSSQGGDDSPAAGPGGSASVWDRLARTRALLSEALASVRSRSSSEEAWSQLSEALIRADVGEATAAEVIASARDRAAAAEKIEGSEAVLESLRAELTERLGGYDRSLARRSDGDTAGGGPAVWLFVGVNGVGKTTTIGKLARREAGNGAGVMLAAGDTFRAAAAEQLASWADRAGAGIVRGSPGADPSSVVYDAVESAAARGAGVVMADTAGRFHNRSNLMEELRKIRRVADKGAGEVTETLLVLDATTGQNGLVQAREFTEAVDVTGVVLTKLDGSAKGGIVVAVQEELGVPVKLVGLGEGIDDLVPFDEAAFVDALLT